MARSPSDPLQTLWRDLTTKPHGRIVLGLLTLYIAELVLSAVLGAPLVSLLAWSPARPLWTLATRVFAQGPGAVISVLVWAYMLYNFLPQFRLGFKPPVQVEMALALWLGETLAAVLAGVAGQEVSLAGWSSFAWGLFVYFGLWKPSQNVSFFGLITFPARYFAWGPLVLSGLFFLAGLSMNSWGGPLTYLGVWCGAYAWWNVRGPAARTRNLRKAGSKVERTVRRFDVHEGGKKGPPPGKTHPDGRGRGGNRAGDDDVWH